MESEIASFYDGRSVFVTGATGFVGKALVEKLLRSCPGIDRIYILVRPRKGKDVASRLEELVSNEVFERIRPSGRLSKIVAVEGDVTEPGLGLSSKDLQSLIDNVSIVFHSAATVRFDEELKTAIELNLQGPRRMLDICRQLKHLTAMIHVSTAYVSLDKPEAYEVISPTKIDPHKMLDFLEPFDDDLINKLTPYLLGSFPNTYTFTKALAEKVIEKERGNLPVAIVRPSIIVGAFREPYPGWIDSTAAASAVMLAGGTGIAPTYKGNFELVTDLIPVDFVVNTMITVAWETSQNNDRNNNEDEPLVYMTSSSSLNPLPIQMLYSTNIRGWREMPTRHTAWIPNDHWTTNEVWFILSWVLFRFLPAYLIDFLRIITFKKPRWVRLCKKFYNANRIIEFFVTREWRFVSERPYKIHARMSEVDRNLFCFDVRLIDWKAWIPDYVAGMRRYTLHDKPETLPLARKRLRQIVLFKRLMRVVFTVILPLCIVFYFQRGPSSHDVPTIPNAGITGGISFTSPA